jgi:hypothetical protein
MLCALAVDPAENKLEPSYLATIFRLASILMHHNLQKSISKLITWTIYILFAMIIIVFITVKKYDHKEAKWYSQVNAIQSDSYIDTNTTVCILGTVHTSNKNYNADSIFEIINTFKPDLILTEADTAIYKNVLKEYEKLKIPFFAKIGRGLGFGKDEENETRAVRKYKYLHPLIDIRPYDYEGRNEFHSKYKILSEPDVVMTEIQNLFDSNALSKNHRNIWTAWLLINDTLNNYYNKTPFVINQKETYRISGKRQQLQYQCLNQIVQEDKRLERFKEFYQINTNFWNTRNKIMTEHIANFIRRYPKKRIIVLTGFMHKYYLLNELLNRQSELNFKIKEYYNK